MLFRVCFAVLLCSPLSSQAFAASKAPKSVEAPVPANPSERTTAAKRRPLRHPMTKIYSSSGRRTPAQTGKPVRSRPDADLFFRQVAQVMLDCPGRVWPNYDWKKLQVLYVRAEEKTSLLWKGSDRSVVQVENKDVPEEALFSLYSFFDFRGLATLSIQPEMEGERPLDQVTLLRIAVHEFFHDQGQKDWNTSQLEKRGTLYPLESDARFSRFMLFDRLQRSYLAKKTDPSLLSKASHWYRHWKQAHPFEATHNTDIPEGTAQYVDLVAASLVEKSCQVSEKDLTETLRRWARRELGRTMTGDDFDLSAEGYDMGAIASLILRLDTKVPDWHARVAKGESPLEILLSGVTPAPEEGDKGVLSKMNKNIADRNRQIGAVVDGPIKTISDKNYVRIMLGTDWMQGNFSPLFEVLPRQYPSWGLIPMALEMDLTGDGTKLKTKRNTVYFENGFSEVCADAGFILILPVAALTADGDGFKVKTPLVEGRLRGTMKKDADGFSWICGDQ